MLVCAWVPGSGRGRGRGRLLVRVRVRASASRITYARLSSLPPSPGPPAPAASRPPERTDAPPPVLPLPSSTLPRRPEELRARRATGVVEREGVAGRPDRGPAAGGAPPGADPIRPGAPVTPWLILRTYCRRPELHHLGDGRRLMHGWAGVWMVGWMDPLVEGWVHACKDGWTGGCMDGRIGG